MPKAPIGQYVGSATFNTKGEAEKFAISQRAKKKTMGYNTRYEIDRMPDGSGFRVREFIFNTDSKGRLIDG